MYSWLGMTLFLIAFVSRAASAPHASNDLIPLTNVTSFETNYANSSTVRLHSLLPLETRNELIGFTYIITNSNSRRALRGNYNTSRPIDFAALYTVFQGLLATLELNIEYFGDGPLTENPHCSDLRLLFHYYITEKSHWCFEIDL